MERYEVQGPDLSCLGLEIRPTFISSRVTQISPDPLTLSSQLAQVWLPHPPLICLASFPRLTLRHFDPQYTSARDEHRDSFRHSPFLQPLCQFSFSLYLPRPCFSSPWHRTPPMLRPELSIVGGRLPRIQAQRGTVLML